MVLSLVRKSPDSLESSGACTVWKKEVIKLNINENLRIMTPAVQYWLSLLSQVIGTPLRNKGTLYLVQ